MSEKINDGGPAFPVTERQELWMEKWGGLTKREWFAGMALQGIMGNSVLQGAFATAESHDKAFSGMAKMAYSLADAMLHPSTKEGGGKR